VGKPGDIEKEKPERTKGKERRNQQRFDCDGFAEVVVDDPTFLFRGNIQNLSLRGCYIQSRAHLRLDRGAEADLHFSLSGDFFHTRARIMIVRAGAGVGFEFLSDDPELQGRIGRLIQKLSIAPSPDVVGPTGTAEEGGEHGLTRSLWDRAT
jgi:PilZ domain